jgi:hypothetical protein
LDPHPGSHSGYCPPSAKAKQNYGNGFDAYQWLGYHLADIKSQKAGQILIPSKLITPNAVIFWLASLVHLVIFLGFLMR